MKRIGLFGITLSFLSAIGAVEYPCETHARMQPSRQSPEWLRRGVICQFKTANFTPEGTIRSAQARLAYLAELGVNREDAARRAELA